MEQKLDLLSPDEQARFIAAARAWNEWRYAVRAGRPDDCVLADKFDLLMAEAADGFDD